MSDAHTTFLEGEVARLRHERDLLYTALVVTYCYIPKGTKDDTLVKKVLGIDKPKKDEED